VEPPPLEEVVEEAEREREEEGEEDCTPERLDEIRLILLAVYAKFSPEKLGKIDRLLAKYVTHEEEFLRFVFHKYSVSAEQYR
jgi:DNA-directed RNA polymerase subunit F